MNNLTLITLNQPKIKNFAKARNKALKQAKTSWILFLDSDEKLSPALKKEIQTAVKNKNYNYQLKRQDKFLGKTLKFGETAKYRSTRLVQKKTGSWQNKVHEKFISKLPVKTLKNPLLHHRSITTTQFINRLNYYSGLRAQEINKFSLFQLIFYPPLKFFKNYIIRFGFLDGLSGLIMTFLMSLHSFMVRVKVYEKKTH